MVRSTDVKLAHLDFKNKEIIKLIFKLHISFNNSLIEDESFIKFLKSYANNMKPLFDDIRVNWEFLKYKFSRFSKGYANEATEKRKTRRKSPEKEVGDLEEQVNETK